MDSLQHLGLTPVWIQCIDTCLFFWVSTLYLGRIISEACFLLHWPHAALLVCGVSFPHGSSREKACRLSRTKCKGSVTSRAVLAGQITDKPPHGERYGVFTTSWSQESNLCFIIYDFFFQQNENVFFQTLIVYTDPTVALRDTLSQKVPLWGKEKGQCSQCSLFLPGMIFFFLSPSTEGD